MMSFVDVLLLIIALPVILSIIGVLMALREETETYERADYIRLNRSPSQKRSRVAAKTKAELRSLRACADGGWAFYRVLQIRKNAMSFQPAIVIMISA